jgi:hypothetical protein
METMRAAAKKRVFSPYYKLFGASHANEKQNKVFEAGAVLPHERVHAHSETAHRDSDIQCSISRPKKHSSKTSS